MVVLHGAARSEVLRSYQSGADAYITSPFDPRELIARMGALVRRQHFLSSAV
jgi:DNA-binding response OmpR family regulator